MQYNGDADGQDIVSLANDFAASDNNNFPLKQKARLANKNLRTIWSWIFSVYGGWLYDDGNQTDLPAATTSLNASQTNYGTPSGALTIRAVDAKTVGGVWYTLAALTEEQIRELLAEPQFYSVPGQPIYYEPYGNSVKIYPPANYTQAASLRVSYDRGSVAFVSTDTTKSPGFASEFHEALAIGMANDFATMKKLSQGQGLQLEWQKAEIKIKDYYSQRYQEMFPPRITIRDGVREFM